MTGDSWCRARTVRALSRHTIYAFTLVLLPPPNAMVSTLSARLLVYKHYYGEDAPINVFRWFVGKVGQDTKNNLINLRGCFGSPPWSKLFFLYLSGLSETVSRLAILFDVLIPDTLKLMFLVSMCKYDGWFLTASIVWRAPWSPPNSPCIGGVWVSAVDSRMYLRSGVRKGREFSREFVARFVEAQGATERTNEDTMMRLLGCYLVPQPRCQTMPHHLPIWITNM